VLSGTLQVQSAEAITALQVGETARYAVDQPHAIRNPGAVSAVGLLVVVHPA
jgi:XRE family transcriptional regulator, regulator of sulfur utilization